MERDGVGQASYMAADDGHRAEFSKRARVAEKHAVEQTPFDIGQGDRCKRIKSRRAERQGCFFIANALLLHEGNELPGDKGQGDEDRCDNDSRCCKNDLEIERLQHRCEIALSPEEQDENQPGHDGRDRKGNVDQRQKQRFAGEFEFGDAPGRGKAEDEIERNGDGRHIEREPDRRLRVFVVERFEIGMEALGQRLLKHG